ncbi:ATP-binding cassette domain-containing protein, partial [Streptomyces sp. NPDC059153]|uniref:ATP-binding cassette domain-containing protein n=1 Tax=Streptomyces sp. NPDC059153 TaxID=3346743 RepID=UPI0036ABB8F9
MPPRRRRDHTVTATTKGLVVEGLCKRYGNHTAVDDVSFTLGPGASLALVGESGSGKTTTVRMLVGLERPDAGTVHLDGRDRSARARGAGRPPGRARAGHSSSNGDTPNRRTPRAGGGVG